MESKLDIQLIFNALALRHGMSGYVNSYIDQEVSVWYTGSDEDVQLEINYLDLVKHVKDHELNVYRVGVDRVTAVRAEDWLDEYLDESVIHYIKNNLNFEIK